MQIQQRSAYKSSHVEVPRLWGRGGATVLLLPEVKEIKAGVWAMFECAQACLTALKLDIKHGSLSPRIHKASCGVAFHQPLLCGFRGQTAMLWEMEITNKKTNATNHLPWQLIFSGQNSQVKKVLQGQSVWSKLYLHLEMKIFSHETHIKVNPWPQTGHGIKDKVKSPLKISLISTNLNKLKGLKIKIQTK